MNTTLARQEIKNYKPLIWSLTIPINLLITIAFFLPDIAFPKKYDFSFLPLLNAILNSLTFISLVIALMSIRQKNIERHKNFILLALFWTGLLLVSYLFYHFPTPSTKFSGQGLINYIYNLIPLTHIFLAAIIVFLALVPTGRGIKI